LWWILESATNIEGSVKALVILSLGFLLLFGGCLALIAGLEKVSVYTTVQVVWLGL
jgi:hypothetical protein